MRSDRALLLLAPLALLTLLSVATVVMLFHDNVTVAKHPPHDKTPPVISDVRAESITESSAVIFWTTDEPADSEVRYGVYPKTNTSGPSDGTLVLSHAATLAGLAPETTYAYCVTSRDAAHNKATACDAFTTTASSTPPEPPAPQPQPQPSGGGSGVEQRVTLSGFAYPDARVTATLTDISGNDATVTQFASTSPDGAFTILFDRFGPGVYVPSLVAQDRTGLVSARRALATFTYRSGGFVFGSADIIMPPTIALARDLIAQDGAIDVSGSAMPDTGVLVTVGEVTHETKSDSAGLYHLSIPASSFVPGRYTVQARSAAISTSGYNYSLTKTINIENTPVVQADLNKDGVVNAADLSIYLAHPFDLTGDGKVTIADFSVFLKALANNL